MGSSGGGFDPGAQPPFKIGDIRAAIPPHCWVKNTWRSLYYVARDVAVAAGLMAAAVWLDSWAFWPLYWFAQGTIFWAIFVIGHDCGHGSFSDNTMLNDVVGHLLHSSILVPYHGWRISHRRHHQNHGHVENDETWAPLPEKLYKKVDNCYKFFRYTFPLVLIAFPYYLVYRSPGKRGSHFNPYSQLFAADERIAVATSTVCWAATCVFLFQVATLIGPLLFLNLYVLPLLIFIGWIAAVTYLHHHESQLDLPWYRGNQWTYLRGGLTTVDRDYGVFNAIHHDIGTHVVHHLFPQIPHYHLRDATKEAKKVMGEYYREPKKSPGPFPFHLLLSLARSIHTDHYVSNTGDVVYYQTDHGTLTM